MVVSQKIAVIIGAGPAGLTAAFELAKAGIKPIVFEAADFVGGISRTINYKGNRIDIGGHRFFSKSDVVMDWWARFMPLEEKSAGSESDTGFLLQYRGKTKHLEVPSSGRNPDSVDEVMLVRSRLSRIFYLGKFFNYPVKLEGQTIKNLGWGRIAKIGFSYVKARIFPLKEHSLEEFYVNRFGRELYNTFFKSYTEKVWGVPVNEIAPDWGAQRVKGLSITKTLSHAVKTVFRKRVNTTDVRQKTIETSLIEHFLYPKLGPGQMWEIVAKEVISLGGDIHLNAEVTGIFVTDNKASRVEVTVVGDPQPTEVDADFVISTMPINELIAGMRGIDIPKNVADVASTLPFRDFMTVGLLLDRLAVASADGKPILDNWIYIQEPHVKVGRLQIFNNWSPYLVKSTENVWVGMEYFVQEGDELWTMKDKDMVAFGIEELQSIGIIRSEDVLDATVIRVKKTYPAYFGSYSRFDEIREFTDSIANLFLVGRNGMHRYNNQDHSMLTAMAAAENIISGATDKTNIWDVNVEQDYHEEKSNS